MANVKKKPLAVANLESSAVRAVRAWGSIARIDLARELKVVASTVGIYVDRLIQDGYLLESTKANRGLGRPAVLIELNPKAGRFIGVDFDARQIMAVTVNFAQQPLAQMCRTLPAEATTDQVLDIIEELIHDLIGSSPEDILGIGLAVPGPIDAEKGIALEYQFIRDWRNVPVGPRVEARFQVPVFVENNLRSMALGELWCSPESGSRDLVCLGIRSGIGSGIIVDGKLLRGSHNLAGEIGRWIYPGESPSGLGALASAQGGGSLPQTIEELASLTALLSQAKEELARGTKSRLGQPGDQPTVAELLAAANDGDELAGSIVRGAANVHGWVIHQLVLLLDPQRIVIAGPLVENATYHEALQGAFAALGSPQLASRVTRSQLGAEAGARGAAALAFHHWTPRRP